MQELVFFFNSYLYKLDPTNDIRIFDGDSLFIPKLINPNPSQIANNLYEDALLSLNKAQKINSDLIEIYFSKSSIYLYSIFNIS